jgi:hypothetical protein
MTNTLRPKLKPEIQKRQTTKEEKIEGRRGER